VRRDFEAELKAFNGAGDRVQLCMSCLPMVRLSKPVHNLKRVSS
jgi:hypothetical protein